MTNRPRKLAYAAIAALIAVTTACGDGDDPAIAAAVDTAQLDPGNYPTTPRDIEGQRTAATGSLQESVRLGEHVPLMFDIDPRMIHGASSSSAKHISAERPPRIGDVETFNERVPGLVAGWRTGGSQREGMTPGLSASSWVMRFQTAAQAEHAADVISAEENRQYPPKGELDIPGFPAGRTFHSQYDAVQSWTPHNEYLLYVYVSNSLATPPDHVPLLDFAKKVFDAQVERLAAYQPTPADQLSTVPADVDGLLARTLAPERAGTYDDYSGVYPVQVYLHLEARPDLAARAYQDAGVDYVAISGSTLFRTSDAAAAERLAAFLVTAETEMTPDASPPGFPGAKCVKGDEGTPTAPRPIVDRLCFLPVGRYVAAVVSTQPQDLHQRLSAQYLLLAEK
ncbi:hypothetical protein IU433_18835 [Nocardia puris]|uniref:DUF7373 family lipoprotein n=1 Tax=Nocardia puris TaxID=208602 RepID=UPI001895A41A|nr:hypothetical protein [Nocardia puris]MBF6212503.1 hypothetical protein [Nocardia puris]MBF6366750.1 hypothetical protein [Nocardia puris]MBF6461092.1 hypothetical protein [Nocardia puris]